MNMGMILPATDLDASLIADADANRQYPDGPIISTTGTFAGEANFRSQFRVIDGALHRVLAATPEP